jgi:hypothetical protein
MDNAQPYGLSSFQKLLASMAGTFSNKKIMFAYYISRVEHYLLTLVAYKTTLTCIGWIARENILSLAKDGATGN